MRRRNDNIRCLTCQAESAPGGRVLNGNTSPQDGWKGSGTEAPRKGQSVGGNGYNQRCR